MEHEKMVDNGLKRLANAPVPAELADLEQRVLGRIAAAGFPLKQERTPELRLAAAAVALVMGIVAGALPSTEAYASAASLSPLDGASALAPSTLLLGR